MDEALQHILLYRNSLFNGFILTMLLGLASLLVALLLGIGSALFSFSQRKSLRIITLIYTTIVRGIPDIVFILLFYFGVQELLNQLAVLLNIKTIQLNAFTSGVLTIGIIFGAFLSETFRGAILAVPKGQMEACIALGMEKKRIYQRVIFPQAMRYALPGISNNWMVMLKTTALVSLIGLKDLVGVSNDAAGYTRSYLLFYLVAGIGYLIFTAISIAIIKVLQQRYSVGVAQGVDI